MTSLDRDLRYSTAPLHERCVYAQLFAARRSIEDALALGREPLVVVARALGVDRDEAASELERLRAAGLVGDGLTLIAGTRARRRSMTATTESATADVEAVRAALEAFTGSRRALARDLGCSEGALRAFASGRRSLGAELLASLAAYLEVRTNNCVPNAIGTHAGTQSIGTQFGTQPLSPSDSLSPSLTASVSSGLSKIEEKNNGGEKTEGEGPGEGTQPAAVRTECVPTAEASTQPKPLSLDGGEARTPRRERRPKQPKSAPAVDPLPPEGTLARRVYEAITTDVALAPITRGPGDLAMRLAALCDGTSVDPAAEVISAGAWQARNREWTDGAAALLRWVKRSTDKARSIPAPVVGTPRPSASAPERIDYQGRRVVGPAGLPPGSVWEKSKEEHEAEEDALYARAYAATQPKKGATGR